MLVRVLFLYVIYGMDWCAIGVDIGVNIQVVTPNYLIMPGQPPLFTEHGSSDSWNGSNENVASIFCNFLKHNKGKEVFQITDSPSWIDQVTMKNWLENMTEERLCKYPECAELYRAFAEYLIFDYLTPRGPKQGQHLAGIDQAICLRHIN